MMVIGFFLFLPRVPMVSSLCFTCCDIIRLMLIRLSVMSLDVCTKLSLVAFLNPEQHVDWGNMDKRAIEPFFFFNTMTWFWLAENSSMIYLCLTESPPWSSSSFSRLSMAILQARFAFLHAIWLLRHDERSDNAEIKSDIQYIIRRKVVSLTLTSASDGFAFHSRWLAYQSLGLVLSPSVPCPIKKGLLC